MAKNTRPLSGAIQRKYFRDLLRSDAGVTTEAVERLTEICVKEIAQIRVRLPLAVRKPAKPSVATAVREAEANVTASTTISPPAPAPASAEFDPHAFSLIVIFRKGGKDALLAKLDEVSDVDRLRAIAKAQHVSLDGELADRKDVLAALIEGTERRIAHRQAAAS
jgi:hypothetical protein